MPATLTRLILSMATVLFVPALYAPIYIILEEALFSNDVTALWVNNIVCGGVLVLTWILVWRAEVSWTPQRSLLTAISLVVAAVPAGAVVTGLLVAVPYREELAAIFGAMIWAPCWLGCTAVLWRETKTERQQRLQMQGTNAPVCPTCGYNLTGLREARCPECGARFTLDQLYAFQRPQGLDIA